MKHLFRRVAIAGLIWAVSVSTTVAADVFQFKKPIQLSSAGQRALAPDIAVGVDGSVHVIWVEKAPLPTNDDHGPGMNHDAADELFYSRSDKGRSFSAPVRVNQASGEVWGFSVSKPELVVPSDGIIHIMFPANGVQAGTGKGTLEARYTRSVNGGRSFEPSRPLNSPAANDLSAVMHGGFAAAHAFGTLAADDAGGVHVFWIDTRLMQEDSTAGAIYTASSRDSGKTFSTDDAIYKNDVCPCCQLAAATDKNQVYLASRQVSGAGDRDSAISISNNRGTSYGEPAQLGEGHWNIAGCPLKRTVVTVAGDHVYTAWYTAGQDPSGVWFAHSSDGGKTFSKSVPAHPDAKVSDAPTLAALDDGRVFLAWHAKTIGPRRIFASLSRDFGRTFSAPVQVPTPDGAASYPELVAGDGEAHLVFQVDDAAFITSLRPIAVALTSRR